MIPPAIAIAAQKRCLRRRLGPLPCIATNVSCSDGDEIRNRSSYSLTVMTLLLEAHSVRYPKRVVVFSFMRAIYPQLMCVNEQQATANRKPSQSGDNLIPSSFMGCLPGPQVEAGR